MGRPEGRVENHLSEQVKAAGGMCLKLSASITNGVPDRVVILPTSGTCFVETKAPGGVLSKLQIVRHEQMRAAGAKVYVATSRKAVDDLINTLTRGRHP